MHGAYLTTYTGPNGDVTKVLDLRGAVTVSPVSTPTTEVASKTLHSSGVTVSPTTHLSPAASKAGSLNTPILDTSDAAMVQAMGAAASVVAQFAAQDKLNGISTVTPITASTPMTSSAKQYAAMTAKAAIHTDAAVSPASTGTLHNRTCVSNTPVGNVGGDYGCFNQYIEHVYSSAVWDLGDVNYASAYMHDSGGLLDVTGLLQGDYYGAHNEVTNWQPRNSQSGGSCSTQTWTVGIWGQTYSTTSTKCPEVSGLYSETSTSFYTKWDGQGSGPNNGSRDTGGVDTIYSPSTASASRSYYLQYWYEAN